ncbi:MAG TPA: hypothetical protein VLG09_04065 [Candidatus Saccharimonadales bacterium]|nr:hypothetical protein [Candidatus Saccharimonadales bacterium]
MSNGEEDNKMATETNTPNNEQDTGNNNSVPQDTGSDAITSDPILSKHLDMAIEAQDGKPETKSGSKEPEGKDADKAKGSEAAKTDSTGSEKDAGTQPKPDKEGKKDEGSARGPKDLVLKGQGPDGTDLVIKGGSERRFYEQLQNARQRNTFLDNEIKARDDRYNELKTKFDTMQQTVQSINGLPPAHMATAARLFTDLQRDPSSTLKKLLAEAVALGHTVEGIGQGVDIAAITAAVKAELGATKETAKEPTEAEILANVTTEVNNFYSRYPDARVHDTLLGSVMRDHPDLTLEGAYFQIKDAFAEKGFDWSRSLEDNVRDTQSSNAAAPNNEPATDTRPMPGGKSPVGNEPIEKHGDVVASENADYGDIVKSAMKDAGFNI